MTAKATFVCSACNTAIQHARTGFVTDSTRKLLPCEACGADRLFYVDGTVQ